MAIAVMGFLLVPRDAHAQFSSGLETLRDALAGNNAARTLLQSELGGSLDVDTFLYTVSSSMGGTAAASNAINQALGGNALALSSLQNALGGNSMQYDDGWGWWVPIPQANDLINSIVAGSGATGLLSMQQLLQGNAGATAVFNVLLDGNANILRDTLISTLGNGNLSTAITQLGNAMTGEPNALDMLNLMVSSANDIWPSLGIDNLGLDFLNLSSPLVTAAPPAVPPAPPPAPPAPPAPPPAPPAPPPAAATPFTGEDPPPGPEENCDTSDAPLTGSFAVDPCTWARDSSFLGAWGQTYYEDDLTEHQAGWQVVEYVRNWWNDQFRPALQNMTAQWHASTVDQSRQLGSMMDSHSVTRSARNLQEAETEAKMRLMPNEKTCSAGSAPVAMASGQATANAVASALTSEITRAVNSSTASLAASPSPAPGPAPAPGPGPAPAPAPAPAAASPAETKGADLAKRFETFCQYFLNPQMNDGENPCPNPTTAGEIVDGDIDIENFLFKDTIDFAEEPQRIAATSLLRNLIQPYVVPQVQQDLIDAPPVQEWILKQEHLKSIRTVATDIVASIMSRRMALPETGEAGVHMPPPPPATPPVGTTPGGGSFDAFLARLGKMEGSGNCAIRGGASNGYLGLYQMGHMAMQEAGCISSPAAFTPERWNWTGLCGNSIQQYLGSCSIQRAAVERYHGRQWNYIGSCAKGKIGTTAADGTLITPSGLLGAAHLVGAGGVRCMVGCGGCSCCTLNAQGIPIDKFRTPATKYLANLSGYEIPWDASSGSFPGQSMGPGNTSPPPDPRPINEIIQEIRRKAGVPEDQIAEFPSYNEIMQALTQERYFDPDYYIRMANNLGALIQEQSVVNAYITIQLQDIYKLQEQINSLLAARAALQINAEPPIDVSRQVPNRR